MNEALAIVTAIGSLGGLGGTVWLIFRAGMLRQELRETRDDVRRIDERGCMYRLEHKVCAPVKDGV